MRPEIEVLYWDKEAGEARVRQGHRYHDVARRPGGSDFDFLKHFGDGDYESGTVINIEAALERLGSDLGALDLAVALAAFYERPPILMVRALSRASRERPDDFLCKRAS